MGGRPHRIDAVRSEGLVASILTLYAVKRHWPTDERNKHSQDVTRLRQLGLVHKKSTVLTAVGRKVFEVLADAESL